MNFRKTIASFLVGIFLTTTLMPAGYAHAQATAVLGLPQPGTMVALSQPHQPVLLKGLKVDPKNPMMFDFIVSQGQDKESVDVIKAEAERQIKYFLAALAIPDEDLWVNLSPYEKDRMVPSALGNTELGRDMLAQDYLLKQITASLIYPEKELGKSFWDKVYKQAQAMYGTSEVPVNTFNKVWIVADQAKVFEHGQTVFVVSSHLKVMLEEDYLAKEKALSSLPDRQAGPNVLVGDPGKENSIASQITREIILPELEKEVNTGKNFANLRQIYNSMILAVWFKSRLKQSFLNQVYANTNKIDGVDAADKTVKEKIYQQYLAAYRKGVFNYIKEESSVPRKYFSGGVKVINSAMIAKATGAEFAAAMRKSPAMFNAHTSFKTPTSAAMLSLRERWAAPEVGKRIEKMFTIEERGELFELLSELDVADISRVGDLNKKIVALINKVNAKSTRALLAKAPNGRFFPAKKFKMEDLLDKKEKDKVIKGLKEGEYFFEVIAGGMADRMKKGLEQLGISGLGEGEYRIWNVNVWKIIKQIKASFNTGELNRLPAATQKLLSELNAIDIPEWAEEASSGVRNLFAISQGIDLLPVTEDEKELIRRNITILIHINDDIQEDVHRDLLTNQFFGFDPRRVVIVNGGYGDVFDEVWDKTQGGHVTTGQVNKRESWNHGAAVQELDWVHGYTLDDSGFSHNTQMPVYDYLETLGAKYGLARRINDGILLHPKGAMDVDFLTAFLKLREEKGVNFVAEVVKNTTGEKGGLAVTLDPASDNGFLLEGLNVQEPDIRDGLDKNISYNRFYIGYALADIRKALRGEGGLPMSIKYRGIGHRTATGVISPEIPAGDISKLSGVRTAFLIRGHDFLLDEGLIPMQSGYNPGEEALIHDYKNPESFLWLHRLVAEVDNLWDLKHWYRDVNVSTGTGNFVVFYNQWDRVSLVISGLLKQAEGFEPLSWGPDPINSKISLRDQVLQGFEKHRIKIEQRLIGLKDADINQQIDSIVNSFLSKDFSLDDVFAYLKFYYLSRNVNGSNDDFEEIARKMYRSLAKERLLPEHLTNMFFDQFILALKNPAVEQTENLKSLFMLPNRILDFMKKKMDDVESIQSKLDAVENRISLSVVYNEEDWDEKRFLLQQKNWERIELEKGLHKMFSKMAFMVVLAYGMSQEKGAHTEGSSASEAMATAKMVTPGGIDLNAKNLNLQSEGDGVVDIQFDPAAIEQFKKGDFTGIVPVIINVTPIPNLMPFIGLNKEDLEANMLASV